MFSLGANLIWVTDLERAKRWYEDVFGMVAGEYRPPEFLEMKLGDATFYIETVNDKRAPGLQHVSVGGRHSAVFVVENIKKTIEGLRAKGVRIVVEPVQQYWGDWNAVIADPDGNEFILDSSD